MNTTNTTPATDTMNTTFKEGDYIAYTYDGLRGNYYGIVNYDDGFNVVCHVFNKNMREKKFTLGVAYHNPDSRFRLMTEDEVAKFNAKMLKDGAYHVTNLAFNRLKRFAKNTEGISESHPVCQFFAGLKRINDEWEKAHSMLPE